MNDDLFNKLEELDKVPSSLLTEVTPPAAQPDLDNLLNHTDFKPVFDTGQSNTQATGQNAPISPQMSAGGNNLAGSNQLSVGNLLTPEMATGFMNILIPAAIVLLIEKTTKQRVVKSQFEATAKEIEILKPVLANYLNSINFKVDTPFNALIITVAFIYGSKVVEAVNGVPKNTIKTGALKAMNPTGDIIAKPAPRKRSPDNRKNHMKKAVV